MSTVPGEAARLAPLSPPYAPELREALARWMPPGSQSEPLALFRTMYLNAQLAGRMRPLGAGILGASATVPARLREVMIQRTCALTGAEYEWGVHAAAFADAVGLDAEQLRGTVHGGPDDACWGAEETIVLRIADELHESSSISDETWDALSATFAPEQIIELIVTAGWYHVIAYLCNGLRVEREPWARRFPPPASARE